MLTVEPAVGGWMLLGMRRSSLFPRRPAGWRRWGGRGDRGAGLLRSCPHGARRAGRRRREPPGRPSGAAVFFPGPRAGSGGAARSRSLCASSGPPGPARPGRGSRRRAAGKPGRHRRARDTTRSCSARSAPAGAADPNAGPGSLTGRPYPGSPRPPHRPGPGRPGQDGRPVAHGGGGQAGDPWCDDPGRRSDRASVWIEFARLASRLPHQDQGSAAAAVGEMRGEGGAPRSCRPDRRVSGRGR